MGSHRCLIIGARAQLEQSRDSSDGGFYELTMRRLIIFLTAFLALALAGCATSPPQSPPPLATWGERFNTPGVYFRMEKQGLTTETGTPAAKYSLRATGFPKDKTYLLWKMGLDSKPVFLGRLLPEASDFVWEPFNVPGSLHLSKATFTFLDMFRGEAIWFAFVANDETVKAFIHVVPFPLEAKGNAGCSMFMELLPPGPGGPGYLWIGQGFEIGEEVAVISHSADEVLRWTQKVPSSGNIGGVIAPAVVGRTGGIASLQLSGKRCEVKLDSEWGTAMKRQR